MAILRTITVTVTSADAVSASSAFGGYRGEHLSTRLAITVPAAWAAYDAYVTWKAADGWEGESAAHEVVNPGGLSFNYDLPKQAMKTGALVVNITARYTVGDETQIAHTVGFELNIAYANDFDGAYDGSYNSAIQSLDDRIDSLEAIVGGGLSYVWDDYPVPLLTIKAPASSSPTWTAYKGSEVPAFSASATNQLFFQAQMPHGWKEGSDIELHLHVGYPNANTGNSRWQFTYSWANIDGTFGTETTILTTIAAPGVGGTDLHKIAELAATISATGKTISSVMLCSLARLGADGADTYGSVIYGLSLDFHYQKDALGSRTATAK